MSLKQFIAILLARWRSMLLIVVVVVSATVTVSLLLPKTYTASASVLVDIKTPDPIAGVVLPGMMTPTYMATQVDLIQSDRVALRVSRMLKLDQNASMRSQWQEATGGVGRFENWLAELLQKSLDVKPSRESNVIALGYKSVDPRFAAALANAFAQAYIDVTLEMRVEPARQYSGFFDARAKQMRENLEQAQARLSAFQKDKGIVAVDERLDIETSRLNELSTQLVALQALAAESNSRQTQARDSADTLQDVLANPVVAGVRTDLLRQEARLQEMGARLGDAHPQVIELKANIAELRSKLEQETRRVGSSVGVNNSINQSREAQVRSALGEQRTKVLRLKEVRDEVNVLTRDVEYAQRAYDGVQARANLSNLESLTTQTNLVVISAATEPIRASSPRPTLNALVAVFVGTLLATGVAMLRELRDRRVRTNDDLIGALQLPLLGVLPKPARSRLFGRAGGRGTDRSLWRGLRGSLPRGA
jgi:chain length determinant protein EpsF